MRARARACHTACSGAAQSMAMAAAAPCTAAAAGRTRPGVARGRRLHPRRGGAAAAAAARDGGGGGGEPGRDGDDSETLRVSADDLEWDAGVLASPTVAGEGAALAEEWASLTAMQLSYPSFDSTGKRMYIEQLEGVLERLQVRASTVCGVEDAAQCHQSERARSRVRALTHEHTRAERPLFARGTLLACRHSSPALRQAVRACVRNGRACCCRDRQSRGRALGSRPHVRDRAGA